MDWFEITAFPDRIFRIREPALAPLHGSNAWLVVGERASLLIDTGVGVAPLRPAVEILSGNPIICLLTHAHYDHIGGAHEFPDRRAHALEAAILADPNPSATQWGGWLSPASFARLPSEYFDFANYALTPAPPTSLVAEGDVIDLGGRRLQILHMPGHSPGLLGAFEAETGALFTSDALYEGRLFFDIPGADREDAARSLARLVATPARVAHPGHFQSLSGEDMRRLAGNALARLTPPQCAGDRGN
jgi:glyoxylase-like metal-dependent hydrolase (beta-lactamase superfamily II)